MPTPPSLTLTFGHLASSATSFFQPARISDRRPVYGPTPSTPPTWLRMIVVPGKARARSIASGNCGWYCQDSKLRPSGPSCAKPSRNLGSRTRWGGIGRVANFWIESLASHETPWRMPRKRPPPTLISASSTSRTLVPRVRSAWPTIPSATAGTITARRTHRRNAVDELDLADQRHFGGTVLAVHRAAFEKDGRDDVVATANVGQELAQQIPPALRRVPKMMVRIDGRQPRLQCGFTGPLRQPRLQLGFIAVSQARVFALRVPCHIASLTRPRRAGRRRCCGTPVSLPWRSGRGLRAGRRAGFRVGWRK